MNQLNKTSKKEQPDIISPTNSPEIQKDGVGSQESQKQTEILQQEDIRLLEERLVVKRSRKKLGEVVVRKEIETEMVQVPVRREKLIVEQIGSENVKLAEIDLGREEITGVEVVRVPQGQKHRIVKGEFLSPEAASALLRTIALQDRHGCMKVSVEIVVNDSQLQENYQEMFDRCRFE